MTDPITIIRNDLKQKLHNVAIQSNLMNNNNRNFEVCNLAHEALIKEIKTLFNLIEYYLYIDELEVMIKQYREANLSSTSSEDDITLSGKLRKYRRKIRRKISPKK